MENINERLKDLEKQFREKVIDYMEVAERDFAKINARLGNLEELAKADSECFDDIEKRLDKLELIKSTKVIAPKKKKAAKKSKK